MIIAIIILFFASAFFSGSETALTAVNKMKLQTKANNGDVRAQKLLRLVYKPNVFITTILIGNNIANILLPTLVTAMAIDYGVSVAVASASLTISIIVLAEVIPKSIAATFPERVAFTVRPVISFFLVVFKPVTVVLNWLTDTLTRILSKGEVENASVSKEELRTIVDIADSEGIFAKDESYRIRGALDFRNLNVKDVLTTPRTEMEALSKEATYEEVRDFVIEEMYTRYPVFGEDMDDIIGIFHSKYLLQWSVDPSKPLMDYCDSDPITVHEFQTVEFVLRKMTKERRHMAIVIDEFGGTEGILTHEDIIEAMLGFEIEDETDLRNDPLVESMTEVEIVCDGKITLHRLNSIFRSDIPEEEDTLSGYLFKEFNDFPEAGDTLEEEGLIFEVKAMEEQMIRKVYIKKKNEHLDKEE
ncbi:hemolysin family protein [Salinicoccus sp. HZC-1]|uniref:hemolysin family protein n=1 Tax=Salinicoccus sp. HZC-1 TaxID=3385497 RepID=UPI00398B6253